MKKMQESGPPMSFEAMREQLVSEGTAVRQAKDKLNSGKLQNALM